MRAYPQAVIAVGLILVALYAIRHTLSATTLVVLAVIVPSIILHEVGHGVAALAFGDGTAREAGRLTLNPLRHVDPVGTLVLPAVLALSGLGVFGYAKPVPINPARMRSPRNHALLTSLAGPSVNVILAGLSIVLLRTARPDGTAHLVQDAINVGGLGSVDLTDRALWLLGFVNVTLAAFNLLPVPPLDGSAVLDRMLPASASASASWQGVRRYAMPALLVLVLWNPHGVLGRIFEPAERAWGRLLACNWIAGCGAR